MSSRKTSLSGACQACFSRVKLVFFRVKLVLPQVTLFSSHKLVLRPIKVIWDKLCLFRQFHPKRSLRQGLLTSKSGIRRGGRGVQSPATFSREDSAYLTIAKRISISHLKDKDASTTRRSARAPCWMDASSGQLADQRRGDAGAKDDG
jgi:hypothetical protein